MIDNVLAQWLPLSPVRILCKRKTKKPFKKRTYFKKKVFKNHELREPFKNRYAIMAVSKNNSYMPKILHRS